MSKSDDVTRRFHKWMERYSHRDDTPSESFKTFIVADECIAKCGVSYAVARDSRALPPNPQDLPHGADPVMKENEAKRAVPARSTVFGPAAALRPLPSFALSFGRAKATIATFHDAGRGKPKWGRFSHRHWLKEWGLDNGRRLIERWWVEFRPQVPQRFAALYKEYNSLKDQGKKEEAEQKFQRIKDLGIDVLPLLIDKIQQGDTSLIPAVAYLTDKKVPESASPSECVSWWAANKAKFTLPPATE